MTFLTKSAAQFVGTWELVSIDVKRKNGDWGLGRNHPVGVLMFDDVGNMAVQITTDPREVDNPGADSEFVRGYIAYYGKYEVDIHARTITHHRLNHINPRLGQLSVIRSYDFSGDTLTLTVVPDKRSRLNWSRVR